MAQGTVSARHTPATFYYTRTMTLDETIAQWNSDYAARLTILKNGVGAGIARPEQFAGKTGLEQMQAMLVGELPSPHIAHTMDFSVMEVALGRAVFQGTPQLKHYNPLGSVHGGWYATLLDSAMGCAVHTMMPAGRAYTTAELSINIVRAASHQSGPLRAMGSVIHCGKQLATAEGKIVGADGKLYAHATTTCLVFEMPQRQARE
jgi:uncharacterized protein (TIGR00369 family)